MQSQTLGLAFYVVFQSDLPSNLDGGSEGGGEGPPRGGGGRRGGDPKILITNNWNIHLPTGATNPFTTPRFIPTRVRLPLMQTEIGPTPAPVCRTKSKIS